MIDNNTWKNKKKLYLKIREYNYTFVCFYFFYFFFKEEEEKHQCKHNINRLLPAHPLPGIQPQNPGIGLDWEWNQRPFVEPDNAQTTEPHGQGSNPFLREQN